MTRAAQRGSLGPVRAPPILQLLPAALLCAGLAGGAAQAADPSASADRSVELFVQRRLVDARTFREQGRLEAAERALQRALAVSPDDPAAHRLMARVLEEQGRRGSAARHWTLADELDPPPPAPPDTPIGVSSEGLVVVLVDGASPATRERRPSRDLEAEVLRKRVATRLPWAKVMRADPESISDARELLRSHEARAAISLRTERGFCSSSRKDGHFAVAWLRVASATPQTLVSQPQTVREVFTDPPEGETCVPAVLARGLERALLETPALDAVRHGDRSGPWPSPALRALFPGIGRRVALNIERGRARLATGRIESAAEAFRSALEIDPEDPDAHAYLKEAEDTLAIARALDPGDDLAGQPHGDDLLEFSLSPAERTIAETRLDEERRRRDDLLAALVIAEVEERPPPPEAIQTLRRVEMAAPPAPGPRLARERTEGAVESRALLSEEGRVVTIYYFAVGSDVPLLREEDTNGDGRPDRWIGYENGVRRDLWEDRAGRIQPDIHVRFASDGLQIDSISVDDDGDRRPERVFRYADGQLASEARDTDGDGLLDRFETFNDDGLVITREEDLNADGHADVRTRYRNGRLLSREIENPAVVEALLEP